MKDGVMENVPVPSICRWCVNTLLCHSMQFHLYCCPNFPSHRSCVSPREPLPGDFLLNFPYCKGQDIIIETYQERYRLRETARKRFEDSSGNEIVKNSSKMKKTKRYLNRKLKLSRRGVRTAKALFRRKQFTEQILL